MYLLDTNVISELRKMRPHSGVTAWLGSVDERNLSLSAASFGEIQAGIELTREQDPAKAADLETWANVLAETWTILPMNDAIFRVWAKLIHRRSDDLAADAMIAATAIVHRFVVVTRNVRDFRIFKVETLNPYDTPRAD